MNSTILNIFQKHLIEFYGEENVGYFRGNHEGLAVHFNELKVTVSDDSDSWVIKDIYFIFDDEFDIICFRGTLTDIEYFKRYLHSHSTRSNLYGYFCLGSSPYKKIRDDIKGDKVSEKDLSDNLQALVLAFNEMIRTESIQGVPYIKIKELKISFKQEYVGYSSNYNIPFPFLGEVLNKIKKEDTYTLVTFINFLIQENLVSGQEGNYYYVIHNNVLGTPLDNHQRELLDSFDYTNLYVFKDKTYRQNLIKSEHIKYDNIIRLKYHASYYHTILKAIQALI